jgi:hypothetical protein
VRSVPRQNAFGSPASLNALLAVCLMTVFFGTVKLRWVSGLNPYFMRPFSNAIATSRWKQIVDPPASAPSRWGHVLSRFDKFFESVSLNVEAKNIGRNNEIATFGFVVPDANSEAHALVSHQTIPHSFHI